MTPAEWKRIKEITADALDRDPSERDRFVAAACGGDEVVLREVRRVLAAPDSSASDFLSVPAGDLQEVFRRVQPGPCFAAGETVSGRFQILRFLSRGGMGEVYAAQDILEREAVALKTILSEIARSPEVIERFRQEVKQTRSISHPNVCPVRHLFSHEQPSGEVVWFLSMKLLEGQTLADRLAASGPLALNQALPLIQEMTDGLRAAHEMGIVHRDFKPSNVMLVRGEDGGEHAVVMDFGLAESVATGGAGGAGSGDGTPAFMAPEQMNGGEVGYAADQFALGLVIAEILAGKRPELDRSTAPALRETLQSWFRLLPQPLSPQTQRAIRRCLEFRPGDRFRDVREVVPVLDGSRQRVIVRRAIAAGMAMAALVALVFVARSDWGDRVTNEVRVTPEADLSGQPSLSRNGKWIAYVSNRAERDNLDIWIDSAQGEVTRRLTTHPAEDAEPGISPDGRFVAFRSERDGGGIYLVGTDGSNERLLVAAGRNPAVSPDGRTIAYWTGSRDDSAPSARMYVIPAEGGTPRRVAGDFADARYPVWNSDGSFLLFDACRTVAAPLSSCAEWWTVRPDGTGLSSTGALALLRAEKIQMQSPPLKSWSGDRLLFDGARGNRVMLWELTISRKDMRIAGRPLPITSGDASERNPVLAEAGVIAFGRVSGASHVWRIPVSPQGENDRDVRITDDPSPSLCPNASRDGRWLFFVRRTANFRQIFARDLVSAQESVLFPSGEDQFWPVSNRNGDRVAFEARGSVESSIWLSVGRHEARKLCSGCSHPTSWFAGDKALFYTTPKGEIALLDVATGLSRVVLSGGNDVALAGADWSPDQQYLSFTASGKGTVKRAFAVRFPETAAAPEGSWAPLTGELQAVDLLRWSGDGKSIFYLSKYDGHSCIWGQQFDAPHRRTIGKPFPIMHYHDPRFTPDRAAPVGRGLSASADSVFLNVGEVTDTVWTGVLRTPPLRSLLQHISLFR